MKKILLAFVFSFRQFAFSQWSTDPEPILKFVM